MNIIIDETKHGISPQRKTIKNNPHGSKRGILKKKSCYPRVFFFLVGRKKTIHFSKPFVPFYTLARQQKMNVSTILREKKPQKIEKN